MSNNNHLNHISSPFMLRILFLFSLIAMTLIATMSQLGQADAQNPFGDCDNIKSAAEAMECVKSSKEKAQQELNELFEDSASKLKAEELSQFRDAQREWTSFRTQQCNLEAKLAKNDGHRQLYRLKCIEKLTHERISYLSELNTWNKSPKQREFGEYPRWINVLEETHSDIVWDMKSRVKTDLNCDGQEDIAVSGIQIHSKMHMSKDNINPHSNDQTEFKIGITIGIVENSQAHQPKISLKKFYLKSAKADDTDHFNPTQDEPSLSICSPHVQLRIINQSDKEDKTIISKSGLIPQRKPVKGELPDINYDQKCDTALLVQDLICQPYLIYHSNKEYYISAFKGQ